MDYTDDYYDYDVEEPSEEQREDKPKSVTRSFALFAAGLAVILGFSLGLLMADAFGTAGSGNPLYDEALVTSLFEESSPAVVEITITRRNGVIPSTGVGTGSGFLIDREGHIITNDHVVDGADEIRVNLADGRTLSATKLGTSAADDLALIQVDPDEVADIEPLTLSDSEEVTPGQLAIAIGSPFRNFNSVTVGVVSGTGRGPTSQLRRPIPDMIQTDAALNPGNSGGPLLNSQGDVIGVNSAVRTPTFQGLNDFRIGFAVPSNTVISLMPDLLIAKEIRRPWLGISGGPISEQLAQSLNINEGIVITQVFPGSPAEESGLVPFRSLTDRGDVITAVDDMPVSSVEDMVSYFNALRPGDKVTLSILRENEALDVEVTLDEWPDT